MERNRRSSHVYKIHLELENGPFNCGSFFLTKFKKHFKTSKNIDEVTCGNCKKLMMLYSRESSMPIRNGYREQERRRKRDERMMRWEQEVIVTEINLINIPMPPIINHKMIPSRGRLIKSNESRLYDRSINFYILKRQSQVFEERRLIETWIKDGALVQIELNFNWQKEKLFSKKNEPKRLDLDGRIKEAIDAVSDILNFDDKFLFKITANKNAWGETFDAFSARLTKLQV